MILAIFILLVVSALVYEDAKKRDLSDNKWAKSPRDWALGVLLLCLVFLPLYIVSRGPKKV
jgi:hypothetical protein